jgi:hypothetical protein
VTLFNDTTVAVELVGTSVEIANDDTWAKVTLYSDHKKKQIHIHGTPRELRRLARGILDGLKRVAK